MACFRLLPFRLELPRLQLCMALRTLDAAFFPMSPCYFPELLPELEADAPVLELLPVPPAPVLDVGLPKMVWPEVFLLGAKTELKSCPTPCMVLQPVRLIPIKLGTVWTHR
jgi:hypothetical protein